MALYRLCDGDDTLRADQVTLDAMAAWRKTVLPKNPRDMCPTSADLDYMSKRVFLLDLFQSNIDSGKYKGKARRVTYRVVHGDYTVELCRWVGAIPDELLITKSLECAIAHYNQYEAVTK